MDRDPKRCDPADPQKVVSDVYFAPELSVDERIRNVVAQLVTAPPPASLPDEPTDEELLQLEEPEDELVLSPSQMVDLVPEEPPTDLEGAINAVNSLSDADREAVLATLNPPADETPEAPVEPPA